MQTNLYCALLLLVLTTGKVLAQLNLETKYFGSSKYDDAGQDVNNARQGSAMLYRGDIKIPLAMRMNKDSLPITWGVQAGGAYVQLDNQNFGADELILSDITNAQLTVFNSRPLNEKWTLLAFAGAGVFTANKPLAKVDGSTVLGTAGALFIKSVNPNLQLGGGVALNNAFGFPMVFPAIYLNYNYEEKYLFRVSMTQGLEASAGYKVNESLSLSVIGELSGQLALLEDGGEKVMFTHQYIIAGVSPEVKLGQRITFTPTAGITTNRFFEVQERKLRSVFRPAAPDYPKGPSNGVFDDDFIDTPYFKLAPYASARLAINF